MEILINGKKAFLKKNTSFEYISENSLFTGSESYTLTITFPLKGCPQNIAIFGHLHRQDVKKDKILFDCEIHDKGFFKAGSITVTQINEVEVKTQFLEGRSEHNFNDNFDDVYLNQINLGYPNAEQRNPNNSHPMQEWSLTSTDPNYVALPWVNNTSGNLQNGAKWNSEEERYVWLTPNIQLSFQPYLIYILKKICEVLGYTGHFEPLEQAPYKYLLICNCLPAAWEAWNFAIAMPHWTLTEFFEQLEYFLAGEFTINHKAKMIRFRFIKTVTTNAKNIRIDKVVNKYTVEVSKDNRADYLGSKNLKYAENDNRYWAYRDCRWYIEDNKKYAVVYDQFSQLLEYARTLEISGYKRTERYDRNGNHTGYSESFSRGYRRGTEGHKLFYARDVDTYFVMWCDKAELVSESGGSKWYKYYNHLEPINQFGKYVVDKEADDLELKCVPAWIDDTDDELGPCLFLECGDMGSAVAWTVDTGDDGASSSSSSGSGTVNVGNRSINGSVSVGSSRVYNGPTYVDETDYDSGALAQPQSVRTIEKGEIEKGDAYFDCLYMAFHDIYDRQYHYLLHPYTDKLTRERGFEFSTAPYSMRLEELGLRQSDGVLNIDPMKKYNFSFLMNEIPDPRAIFFIEGGKYICEKITATFHEKTGRSQLLKGVFYKVI